MHRCFYLFCICWWLIHVSSFYDQWVVNISSTIMKQRVRVHRFEAHTRMILPFALLLFVYCATRSISHVCVGLVFFSSVFHAIHDSWLGIDYFFTSIRTTWPLPGSTMTLFWCYDLCSLYLLLHGSIVILLRFEGWIRGYDVYAVQWVHGSELYLRFCVST
jgi:hypothetical protein